MQLGEGIRTASTVPAGGSLQVEVGTNDPTVEISIGGTGDTKSYDVAANKTASIPVPDVPPGTVLRIAVGSGLRRRIVLVEVTTP